MDNKDLHTFHRKCAVDLFNKVWDLMENDNRTQVDDVNMIHSSHASRYHWGIVGEPVNLARGEWQISRVYSLLEVPERATFHAQLSLEHCKENGIGDFDLAYAYEALARASFVADDQTKFKEYMELAVASGKEINKKEDREVFENDLKSLNEVMA
ncbi:hypothetical protein [Pseudalkalibacillus sp. SCS-8]|uniref:hypothetical protein n=1 Tax=Pseudalkalibacillus nanhaiensis TaxID=3115291 RepID=UPI0032DB6244